jgi:colanic acid/amylovoran biosynthesis protein
LKVLIVNAIALNVGDAAILLGEIRALREAFGEDVEITVSELRPDVASRVYPEVRFVTGLHPWRPMRRRGPRWAESMRRRRTSTAVRLLARQPRLARLLLTAVQRSYLDLMAASDFVISTGGTYFVEHYNFANKVDEVLAAAALGRPTFLYTQSLGPFDRPASGPAMRRIVAACRLVFLRDERSRRHLLAVGAEASKLDVHSDAAFALARARTDADSPAHAAGRESAPERHRIAFSVRAWADSAEDRAARDRGEGNSAEKRFRRAVADATRALVDEGMDVTFMSTCQGLPEFSDDSRYAQGIVDEFLPGVEHVCVDSRFRRPEDLSAALGAFDLAICTRMHFLILALTAHTPAIAIAYEFKSRELMTSLGYGHLVADYEKVTGDWLTTSARAVLRDRLAARAVVAAHVDRLRRDAVEPAFAIGRSLAGSSGGQPALRAVP